MVLILFCINTRLLHFGLFKCAFANSHRNQHVYLLLSLKALTCKPPIGCHCPRISCTGGFKRLQNCLKGNSGIVQPVSFFLIAWVTYWQIYKGVLICISDPSGTYSITVAFLTTQKSTTKHNNLLSSMGWSSCKENRVWFAVYLNTISVWKDGVSIKQHWLVRIFFGTWVKKSNCETFMCLLCSPKDPERVSSTILMPCTTWHLQILHQQSIIYTKTNPTLKFHLCSNLSLFPARTTYLTMQ